MDCCHSNAPASGCEQGRSCPVRKLTERDLDARIEEIRQASIVMPDETEAERLARIALPDLTLKRMVAEEVITGPYRPTFPLVRSAVERVLRELGAWLMAPRAF